MKNKNEKHRQTREVPVSEEETMSLAADTNGHTNGHNGEAETTKELSKRELLDLFAEYDRLSAPILEAVRLAEQAKVQRSQIVERIAKGTGRKKSWKLPEGRVLTLMYRDDKEGKRWYYFRTPGQPDTLDLATE